MDEFSDYQVSIEQSKRKKYYTTEEKNAMSKQELLLYKLDEAKIDLLSYISDDYNIMSAYTEIVNIINNRLYSFERIDTLNAYSLIIGMYLYDPESNEEYPVNKDKFDIFINSKYRNIMSVLRYIKMIKRYYSTIFTDE